MRMGKQETERLKKISMVGRISPTTHTHTLTQINVCVLIFTTVNMLGYMAKKN